MITCHRFVTKADLVKLGLDHLLGTPLLRAYMHGFFVDNRLYNKAKWVYCLSCGCTAWSVDGTACRAYGCTAWSVFGGAVARPVCMLLWKSYGCGKNCMSCARSVVASQLCRQRPRFHCSLPHFVLPICTAVSHTRTASSHTYRFKSYRRSLTDPFAYEAYRAQRVAKKLEDERSSRISVVKKLPKVNAKVAAQLLEQQQQVAAAAAGDAVARAALRKKGMVGPDGQVAAPDPLGDDRFKCAWGVFKCLLHVLLPALVV